MQTKSTHENDHNSSNHPSAHYAALGSTDEEQSPQQIEEEDEEQLVDGSDSDSAGGEFTPDVQKIHFDQTVAALFNIKAQGLTMPPFD